MSLPQKNYFQDKTERTVNCMTPAWLNDNIVKTRRTKQKHLLGWKFSKTLKTMDFNLVVKKRNLA